jgi:CcmD family protein
MPPITGPNNWAFVGAAYAVTWITIIGYWVHVHRRLREARQDLDAANAAGGT